MSIAVIEWSSTTNRSATKRYPIVAILHFISVELVFNHLSNVRLLHGMDTKPHASSIYGYTDSPYLKKVCNALLESILNHILTTKHLKIAVGGEYTYGLPRFL